MRRKDRECSNQDFMLAVLDAAETVFVAFIDHEYPYCLPFNFAKLGSTLYFHSALEGKKLELLRQNPHVGFSAAIETEIIREKATTYYKSVCGAGIAEIVEDATEKGLALDAIGAKYKALCKRPAPPEMISRVAVWKIAIRNLTGKGNLPNP